MKLVQELDVYILAEELSDMVWDDFDDWPPKAKNTIGYQIVRSSDSIAANLAEGYGRFTLPERKRFYYYSRGSFEETKAWLRKLVRRNLVAEKRVNQYKFLIQKLGPKLNAFVKSTDVNCFKEDDEEYETSNF